MKKICLIKAGNYLLGIDAATILKRQDLSHFIAEEEHDDVSLVLLASLFDAQRTVFTESESFIMEVKSTTGSQILVINSFAAENISSDSFESLPPLYPELTRLCCPQILIYKEQPILLLDVDGLETVLGSMKNDFAVVSSGALRKEILSANSIVIDSKEDEKEDTQYVKELDDALFNVIVSWTIAEFIKRGSDEDCVITLDELSREFVPVELLQGVNSNLLQGLIDKTIQKCEKFHRAAMQRLRQASALVNP